MLTVQRKKTSGKENMVSASKSLLIVFVICSIFLQGVFAEVICEKLPTELCAFAVSSSAKRCVLENYVDRKKVGLKYACETSEVVVESISGHIETDSCIDACGVDRKFVGISSDAFLAPSFVSSLCSAECYLNCPNIVDLYFNLAAGEGVYLPSMCEKQRENPHRSMLAEVTSNGAVNVVAAAEGPVASGVPIHLSNNAPAPSPF